ncbi:acyl carrier protein [Thiohalobacter thiocyanaticus]|uniref:Acyl carrier protein n=1 Tax=Thiohalobacter thiocyanaticus TaxID=585455 RepID=A0A426QH15_9GAMM|nr:acyl carrier protein [Thiohalobacter thiocyanaticus]RRQ21047.1 acyl carrier protein [Thiohalobacter thiocyanaticus]
MSTEARDQYQEILQGLYTLLARFPTGNVELKEQTDLVADMGLDSINVMELLQEIEDRFDIIVPLNVMSDIRTVQDLAIQVQRLLGENS